MFSLHPFQLLLSQLPVHRQSLFYLMVEKLRLLHYLEGFLVQLGLKRCVSVVVFLLKGRLFWGEMKDRFLLDHIKAVVELPS